MRRPTDWLTPDVRPVARGLRNAQDLSSKFRNYLMADDLLRLLQSENLSTEFGQSDFFSILFLLRVPSGTLRMRRADDLPHLTEFSPQEHKVLVGVRRINGSDLPLAKFSWRGNMKRGCILRRPCLCSDLLPMEGALCPVRRIWPRICSRVRMGDLISPSFSDGSFSSKLKSSLIDVGFHYGARFSPHCFRTGGRPMSLKPRARMTPELRVPDSGGA